MSMLVEKKFKDERLIAYSVIDKIKSEATALSSGNPKHKDGVKFLISKKRYDAIINTEVDSRCARHMNRESIKDFINNKLIKL
jgi:hypothetical protein